MIINKNIFILFFMISFATISISNISAMYSSHSLAQVAAVGDVGLINELLDKGYNVDGMGSWSRVKPLHYAAKNGHVLVVILLLNHGAKIDISDEQGNTPLHHAAFQGHVKVVDILLENKASINLGNHSYNTPLHCAASAGHKPVVELLLSLGADREIKNELGFTAIQVARQFGQDDIVELIEGGNKQTIF